MFNSLTRIDNTLINPNEIRALVKADGTHYTLLLRDGTKLDIAAPAAQSILELVKASEIVEKARAIVEATSVIVEAASAS